MGSEQSTPSGSSKPSSSNQDRQVLDSPSRVLLSREGALSPRQDSVCSESDAPYVPYTVNKPIGDSPKKTDKSKSKFSSPRLRRANDRLSKSALNTLVTVNKLRISDELKYDEDLIKLQEIPAFLPIMQGSLEGGGKGSQHLEILSRLDSGPLNCILQRYEDHLRSCAARVAADQGAINKKIKDVEGDVVSLTNSLQNRHRDYERSCERLSVVRDISRSLAKCHMLLNENIDMMDALNSTLPQDLRLEPFVWTTG